MTCLILTRNRRLWLPYALRCAQYQTYPHKEILVVSSGTPVTDLIPPSVRHLHLPGNPTIGAMRNAGANAARGEIIAHHDDDDLYGPKRLEDQVARLIASGKAVTGYSVARCHGCASDRDWWLYRGSAHYSLGSSLVYWKWFWQKHPFGNGVQVGEDNELIARAVNEGQFISAPAKEHYWFTEHPGNTSPRNKVGKQWERLNTWEPEQIRWE